MRVFINYAMYADILMLILTAFAHLSSVESPPVYADKDALAVYRTILLQIRSESLIRTADESRTVPPEGCIQRSFA